MLSLHFYQLFEWFWSGRICMCARNISITYSARNIWIRIWFESYEKRFLCYFNNFLMINFMTKKIFLKDVLSKFSWHSKIKISLFEVSRLILLEEHIPAKSIFQSSHTSCFSPFFDDSSFDWFILKIPLKFCIWKSMLFQQYIKTFKILHINSNVIGFQSMIILKLHGKLKYHFM